MEFRFPWSLANSKRGDKQTLELSTLEELPREKGREIPVLPDVDENSVYDLLMKDSRPFSNISDISDFLFIGSE